jgi:hypothetical protein
VARAALLADPSARASEAVLRVDDVMTAERVLLVNALRGAVDVLPAPACEAGRA